MGETIGFVLVFVWLAIAVFGIAYEAQTLGRRISERDYMLRRRINGAQLRLVKSLIGAARIGLVVNIANVVLGIVVILLSRTLLVAIATPLVLLGGMLGMNLRSYLGGRTLAEIADMEGTDGVIG